MSPHENDFKVTPACTNTHFNDVLNAFMSRRQMVQGSMALALSSFLGVSLSACSDDDNNMNDGAGNVTPRLQFNSIAKSQEDAVKIAEGYTARPFLPYGASLLSSVPDYANDGSNTAAQQLHQVGDHHDGMHYFPITGSSDNGILCVNHENITRIFMHKDILLEGSSGTTGDIPTAEQARKEIRAHGVTVVEIKKANGQWSIVKDSPYNRRVTGDSVMEFAGPVAGSNFVKTSYSPNGTMVRGTLNNCGAGYTPWGTYLTAEENWAGYFHSNQPRAERSRELQRYSVGDGWQGYRWHDDSLKVGDTTGEFARFDITPGLGWENEPNAFGWMVEIDPYKKDAVPKKRTAMGRFAHESADYSIPVEGKPLAFYMGCDSRFEYIYKFITKNNYSKATSNGDNMLNEGTLYAAKFNSNGKGEWLKLALDNPKLTGQFANMADLLVKTRLAADLAGATPMDRPEWSTVHKENGEIYFTLTNNTRRGDGRASEPVEVLVNNNTDVTADAANPRNVNRHGHIVRMREANDDPTAVTFDWDIFVFGSPANAPVTTNLSLLDESNEFASPDSVWLFDNGLMVIETDDSSMKDRTNDQMLFCFPNNRVGEGDYVANAEGLKRFLVGPKGCEITGATMTPDFKTMFINIQHPGENTRQKDFSDLESAWPDGNRDAGATNRPRSATLIITKNDGGQIGF